MTKPLTTPAGTGIEVEDPGRAFLDHERPDADLAQGHASDPKPGHADAETVAGEGDSPVEAVAPMPLSWLADAFVTGLVHCACSHQSVHPDLLPLPDGGIPTEDARLRTADDDNAG